MSDEVSRVAGLAERLQKARKLAGLSQAQAARLMKLHRPTISEIEAGRRRVRADELACFADLYGVSTGWLTAEDDDDLRLEAVVAARELQKMSREDLDALIQIIKAIQGARQAGV